MSTDPKNKADIKFLCILESQSSKSSVQITGGFFHILMCVPLPTSYATCHVLLGQQFVISLLFPSLSLHPQEFHSLTCPAAFLLFKILQVR